MGTPREESPAPRICWTRGGRIGSTHRGAGGGRYMIHRWDDQWLIHFVPVPGYPGVAQQVERVPWIGDRRTLRAAQQSCTAHARRTAEKDRSVKSNRPASSASAASDDDPHHASASGATATDGDGRP